MLSSKKIIIATLLIIILGSGILFVFTSNNRESATPQPRSTLSVQGTQTTTIKTISPQTMKQAIDEKKDIIILDVRTPEEYAAGHLENSKLLTLDTISTKAEEVIPNKNQTIYAYCRSGVRSARAIEQLQSLGYTNVYSMEGGINAWVKANFSTSQ